MATIGMLGSDVKKQLCACLDLGNSCGHPQCRQVGERMGAAHLEILIRNICAVFG